MKLMGIISFDLSCQRLSVMHRNESTVFCSVFKIALKTLCSTFHAVFMES